LGFIQSSFLCCVSEALRGGYPARKTEVIPYVSYLGFGDKPPFFPDMKKRLARSRGPPLMRIIIDNANKFAYDEDDKRRGGDRMGQTNINIRMDEGLKRDFDGLCNDLGLTMTAAFNVFAKTMVRQQRIPFEVSMNVPNADTIAALEEVEQMKKNPSLGKAYTDVDQMMKELLA
jgi:DNA-damage-inducible protein J